MKTQIRNREMCRKCIYRGNRMSDGIISFCDYAGKTDTTCLTLEHGKVRDRRGNDMDNCLLFDDGKKKVKHPYRKLFTKCEREVKADETSLDK